MPDEQHPGSAPGESEQDDAAHYSDEEGVEAEITNVARYSAPPPDSATGQVASSAVRTRTRSQVGMGAGVRLILILALLAAIALVLVLIRFTGDPYGVQSSMPPLWIALS